MENSETKLRVDLSQAPWLECSEKNKLFESRILFKRISPIISPTGKEEMIPLEVIVCTKCGKVPTFFSDKAKDIPEELKSICKF